MRDRRAALIAVAVSGVVLFAAWFVFLRPVVLDYYCDGSAPRWMLEAQGYDGGGCYEVLPTSEAPPGADWTPVCVGLCGPPPQSP